MSQNRGNVGTVSRILATLIMAAIIVAGPLVVYSWITGYIEFSKSGPAITIQSIVNDPTGTDLLVYVQNVGDGVVRLAEDACLYVDGLLVKCIITGVAVSNGLSTMGEGETATLRYIDGAFLSGIMVTVKVTPMFGSYSEKSAYPGGMSRAPSVLDHFEFDPVASPQVSGTAFTITIRALDQYNETFTDYTGANSLNCSGGQISPATTGGFLYGVWMGEVTVTGVGANVSIVTFAQFNVSKMGTSDVFEVVSGD